MRRLAILAMVALATVVVAPVPAGAAPLCTAVGTVNVLNINLTGCTLGPLTFNNFAVLDAGGAPSPTVFAVQGANTFFIGEIAQIEFDPFLPVTPTPPTTWPQDIHFYFEVWGGIYGVDAANYGTAGVIIQETVCSGPLSGNGCATTGQTVVNNMVVGSQQSQTVMFGQGYDHLWIYKDINAPKYAADGSTGAAITSFTQSFHVPEPGSMLLLGSGLIGLAGAVRRRLGRK